LSIIDIDRIILSNTTVSPIYSITHTNSAKPQLLTELTTAASAIPPWSLQNRNIRSPSKWELLI